MSRMILLFLLSCPLWGQTLLTLSVMDPAECKPIGGPGCKQAVPVTCDATNQGPEPILLTKAQCRTLLTAEGIVAIDDAQAAAIWRQRAKDETWGKIARYATFLPIRVALVGLATWQGGASWGLTSAGAYEMLDQGAERAAMRSPEITRNLEAATADNVSVGVGETGTVTAWASAAQVKSLAYEQRTRYQWLAGGVPESMQPKTAPPTATKPVLQWNDAPIIDESTVTLEPVTAPPEKPLALPIPSELACDAHCRQVRATNAYECWLIDQGLKYEMAAWRSEWRYRDAMWIVAETAMEREQFDEGAIEFISNYQLVAAK